MFSIDGQQWNVPCRIERAAEMTASEISGLLLDKSYFNDVLGTYMKYTITVTVPPHMRERYGDIYEALTDPVDGHTFVVPYGQGEITITGRVENVTDIYVRMPDGGQHWKGTRFTVAANHPSKTMSLGQRLTVGRAPLPEPAEALTGDLYTYKPAGWVKTTFTDADTQYY